MIRKMVIEDYEEVYSLWKKIQGFGIRSIDDSKEGVKKFLERNPKTSVVAVENSKIVGAILCGHDGRRATNKFEQADDTAFIRERADRAAETYERARLEGYPADGRCV